MIAGIGKLQSQGSEDYDFKGQQITLKDQQITIARIGKLRPQRSADYVHKERFTMKITEESMKQTQTDQAPPQPASRPQLSEREKLRNMSRSDKLWYIGTYYKFHIAAVFVGLFLVYIVATSLYSRTFTTSLYCMIINSRSEAELNTEPLEQDFAQYLGLGKKEQIITEQTFISYDEQATQYSYAAMAKISALSAAQDLDIIIGDQETIDHYTSLDAFLDLDQELSPELLALVQDRLYWSDGADGSSHAAAIDLSGTAFADASHLAQTPPLLAVISNTANKDNVEALLRYIFDPQP